MSFPVALRAYVKGLLGVAERATCAALARTVRGTAHDRLTRLLSNRRLDWQTLLASLVLKLTGYLRDGYLIIDDTIIDKSFARAIEGIAWVYSSKEQRSILGLSVVVLCWSNGERTIPLALRIWKKNGASKVKLAVALLRWAKQLLKVKPRYVVFDSWYAAHHLLQTIEDFSWDWVCQLKRNRLFGGTPLTEYRRNPYWLARGRLSGGHAVLVARHGKKYFATSCRTWSKAELLAAYRSRWSIETMFRVLHGALGAGHCQARTLRAQTAHLYCCCLAYTILEQEKYFTRKTVYELRREYRFSPPKANLLISQLIFQGA